MMEALWRASLLAANLWATGGLDSILNSEQGAVTSYTLGDLLGVTDGPRHYLAGAAIGGAAGAAVGAEAGTQDNRLQAQAIAAANAQAFRPMDLKKSDVEPPSGRYATPEYPKQAFSPLADPTQDEMSGRASPRQLLAALPIGGAAGAAERDPIGANRHVSEDERQVLRRLAEIEAYARYRKSPQFIVDLSKRLRSDKSIIRWIHWNADVYHLTADDVRYLRDQNVSADVIAAMLAHSNPPPADKENDQRTPSPVEVQTGTRRAAAEQPTPCELVGKRVLLETRTESGPPVLRDVPYLSRLFRTVGWSRTSVPILPPIRHGEQNDCVNAPDEQEILRALPPLDRGVAPILEIFRDDFEIVTEKLVDQVDPPRFFPLIGPAQLHHCHWKCTVYFTETFEATFPFSLTANQRRAEVVYIDTDHLHLFAAEQSDPAPEPAQRCPYCPGGHSGPAKGATPGDPSVRLEEIPLPAELGSGPPPHRVVAPEILVIKPVRLVGKKPLSENALKNICGEHLIRYDGTLNLGIYGSAYVAGMTVGQVKCVVEDHLKPYFVDPQVSVELKINQRRVAQTGATEESTAPPPIPQAAQNASQVQFDIIAAEVDPADFRQRAMKTGVLSDAADFQTFLQQMQAKGKVKMLAQPRVTTWLGHEAWTQSGSDVELKLPAGVGMPPRICRMFVGAEIKFLAKLKDGKIELAVHGSLSDPDEAPSGATGGFDAPGFNVRSLDANAVLNDGQTLLMVADDFPPAQPTKKATLFLVTPRLISPIPQTDNIEAISAPPPSKQMSLADIVRLSQRGIAEDIIVRQMELTESVFKLTVEDILSLNEQGVSDNLIRVMQNRVQSR